VLESGAREVVLGEGVGEVVVVGVEVVGGLGRDTCPSVLLELPEVS